MDDFFWGGGAQSSPTQYRGALISIEIDRQLITSKEDHTNIKKPYEGSGNCVREKTKIQTKTLYCGRGIRNLVVPLRCKVFSVVVVVVYPSTVNIISTANTPVLILLRVVPSPLLFFVAF